MYYTDAHTHLNSDELYQNRQEHLLNFVQQGGRGLINVGTDRLWNERAIYISQHADQIVSTKKCRVLSTVGGHPSEISFGTITIQKDIDAYREHLTQCLELYRPYIAAIGECGMDAHYPGFTPEQAALQQQFFRMQLDLARAYSLPVVIHSRDAFMLTKEVLTDYTDLQVYIHCRGYGPQEIEELLEMIPQLWFGFCGNCTYPKAELLRQSIRSLVNDSRYQKMNVGLLMETDAPWLSPQSRRGKQHAPEYINEQYAFIGEFLDIPLAAFCDRVNQDRQRLFGTIDNVDK